MQRTILVLIASVLILLTAGLVMLFSASMVQTDNSVHFLGLQSIWLFVVALPAAIICARMDLDFLKKLALPMAGICVCLLVLVLIPGIGREINGSWRWIRLGPLTIQPSEFSKIGIIFAAAWWISRRRRYMQTFKRGILCPILGLGMFAGLLLMEPDFGTTLLVGMVVMLLLFIGGARIFWLLCFAAGGAGAFSLLLYFNENRMRRIIAFLDPEKYAQDEAWQLVNALNAFASGGWQGVGLGNSIQKYHYLPEAHTDFIFPIIGEELGLIATLVIVALFMVIFICGMKVAKRAPNDFGRFIALGCTLMISLQALINLAVVTGSMPTKGLALPFISYGGSSLLVCMSMIGLLVNVAHSSRDPQVKKKNELFKDKKRTA